MQCTYVVATITLDVCFRCVYDFGDVKMLLVLLFFKFHKPQLAFHFSYIGLAETLVFAQRCVIKLTAAVKVTHYQPIRVKVNFGVGALCTTISVYSS